VNASHKGLLQVYFSKTPLLLVNGATGNNTVRHTNSTKFLGSKDYSLQLHPDLPHQQAHHGVKHLW